MSDFHTTALQQVFGTVEKVRTVIVLELGASTRKNAIGVTENRSRRVGKGWVLQRLDDLVSETSPLTVSLMLSSTHRLGQSL